MATIGSGISSFADSIAMAMGDYHKKHVAYDQADQLAAALSRIGITEQGKLTPLNDETGKAKKDVVAVVDPKAYDLFRTNIASKREAAGEAMNAISRIGLHAIAQGAGPVGAERLSQERMQSELLRRTVDQPIAGRLGSGELIANTPQGAHVVGGGSRGAATLTAEEGRMTRFNAQQALRARKELAKQFTDPISKENRVDDFLNALPEAGTVNDKGEFIPLKKGQVGGTHVRLGDSEPMDFAEFKRKRALASQYQKLGAIAYGGLTGGAQEAPVQVQTPEEARKLPPGTLYIPPGGDPNHPYQVPLQ